MYGGISKRKAFVPIFSKMVKGPYLSRLELLAFSFHPLLADVKPYLISHLKLMINSMIVMASLVLGLTLLQLLLHCLMYLLNSLNEPAGFVFILGSA